MLRFRDIGHKLPGVTFDQWRPIWLVEFTVLLCFILSFLYWGLGQLTHTIWKQIYMSANNINVIISGTTAIVRVRFVDLWATNITFHWLNWTPLVISMPWRFGPEVRKGDNSWIYISCPWLIFWLIVAYRERLNGEARTAYIKVQHFRTKCFLRQK